MTDEFERRSAALADAVARHPELVGLALLGSASESARSRRDEWSDHDFFAIIAPGRAGAVRPDLSWLPDQDRLALTAREGELGFVAVYDDGHVFEFALAEPDELSDAVAGAATIAVDDGTGGVTALIEQSRRRADRGDVLDPVNDARLVLVKLLIGVGRARRGETLIAGEFVRTWAVRHLVRALRGRFPERSTGARDRIDPLRRVEQDLPEWAAAIEAAVAQDVEPAARALVDILHRLEPGWEDFPSRAAGAVARRLGWEEDTVPSRS